MLTKIAEFLPFRYLVYFPISIYLGKIENPLPSFAILIVWIILFLVLSRILLMRGIRRYEAVGA